MFTATNIETTDASGRFSTHIHVAAAEFKRALISTRTKEGLEQRKAEGVLLGRQVENDFLPTYKRVLAMHVEQMNLNAIARVTNDEGVPTSKGGKWYVSTVRAIVTSETAETVRRVLVMREVGTDATTIARDVGSRRIASTGSRAKTSLGLSRSTLLASPKRSDWVRGRRGDASVRNPAARNHRSGIFVMTSWPQAAKASSAS